MKLSRLIVCFFLLSLLTIVPALAQENTSSDEEAPAIELLPPNYASAQYSFGTVLPDGYIPVETTDEEGRWYLNIIGESWQASAIITAEELPEDVVDVAGFWQLMKDRDPYMAQNITYEKVDAIGGIGAVQSRVEKIEPSGYILAITWVFVKDGVGFTLSGYPPSGGNNDEARDIALAIHDQFRWMTPEEITEFQANPVEIPLPEGREF
ncbi:MAG: hypothetical protein NTY09_09820 [bacterium]|nr:hypothetical protein [bacterium]